MRIVIEHHTTKSAARARVDELLHDLQRRHGNLVQDVFTEWRDDELAFSFHTRGLKATGTVAVTGEALILNGKLPLMVRPFESRIRAAIEKEARSLFPVA